MSKEYIDSYERGRVFKCPLNQASIIYEPNADRFVKSGEEIYLNLDGDVSVKSAATQRLFEREGVDILVEFETVGLSQGFELN